MDQIMIDVGNETVNVGDEVVLIGRSGSKTLLRGIFHTLSEPFRTK